MQMKQSLIVAALAAMAHGQMSAQQVVQNINDVTDLSSSTDNLARSISVTNFFSTGPQLINNFQQIIGLVTEDINGMGANRKRGACLDDVDLEACLAAAGEDVEDPGELLGSKRSEFASAGSGPVRALQARQAAPPYTEDNQLQICDAFREFVGVHQALLATVIGKHGILALTPFTQPLAQVLRAVEGGVDTLAFGIIDVVPTCAEESSNNKDQLDQSLENAVETYDS